MPIEVHCPNPRCARVHFVKSRFAGMRGKCPACASWMYVPNPNAVPRHAPPSSATNVGGGKTGGAAESEEDVGKSIPIDDVMRELASKEQPASDKESEQSAVPQGDPSANSKPNRTIPWPAVGLLLMGMFGLAAVAASPYLPKPSIGATEDFAKHVGTDQLKGIENQYAPLVSGIAGGVALVVMLALLTGRLGRGMPFVSGVLAWLATVASAAIFFLALTTLRVELHQYNRLQVMIGDLAEKGMKGEAAPLLGMQLFAALGGSVLACLALLFAAVVMAGRWWCQMLAFLLLGTVVALVPVWVYRDELGIKGQLPAEIERMLSF